MVIWPWIKVELVQFIGPFQIENDEAFKLSKKANVLKLNKSS